MREIKKLKTHNGQNLEKLNQDSLSTKIVSSFHSSRDHFKSFPKASVSRSA